MKKIKVLLIVMIVAIISNAQTLPNGKTMGKKAENKNQVLKQIPQSTNIIIGFGMHNDYPTCADGGSLCIAKGTKGFVPTLDRTLGTAIAYKQGKDTVRIEMKAVAMRLSSTSKEILNTKILDSKIVSIIPKAIVQTIFTNSGINMKATDIKIPAGKYPVEVSPQAKKLIIHAEYKDENGHVHVILHVEICLDKDC